MIGLLCQCCPGVPEFVCCAAGGFSIERRICRCGGFVMNHAASSKPVFFFPSLLYRPRMPLCSCRSLTRSGWLDGMYRTLRTMKHSIFWKRGCRRMDVPSSWGTLESCLTPSAFHTGKIVIISRPNERVIFFGTLCLAKHATVK